MTPHIHQRREVLERALMAPVQDPADMPGGRLPRSFLTPVHHAGRRWTVGVSVNH